MVIRIELRNFETNGVIFQFLAKQIISTPPENFSTTPPPRKFLNPLPENISIVLEKISTPRNMLTIYHPPPPSPFNILLVSFYLFSFTFQNNI